jgi:hypothetical protein
MKICADDLSERAEGDQDQPAAPLRLLINRSGVTSFVERSAQVAARSPVQSPMHFFARLERRMKPFRHADRSPVFWITPWPSRPCLHEECAKAAQLDPITPDQGSLDLVKDSIHEPFNVAQMQMLILFLDAPH